MVARASRPFAVTAHKDAPSSKPASAGLLSLVMFSDPPIDAPEAAAAQVSGPSPSPLRSNPTAAPSETSSSPSEQVTYFMSMDASSSLPRSLSLVTRRVMGPFIPVGSPSKSMAR